MLDLAETYEKLSELSLALVLLNKAEDLLMRTLEVYYTPRNINDVKRSKPLFEGERLPN